MSVPAWHHGPSARNIHRDVLPKLYHYLLNTGLLSANFDRIKKEKRISFNIVFKAAPVSSSVSPRDRGFVTRAYVVHNYSGVFGIKYE